MRHFFAARPIAALSRGMAASPRPTVLVALPGALKRPTPGHCLTVMKKTAHKEEVGQNALFGGISFQLARTESAQPFQFVCGPTLTPRFGICFPISHLQAARKSLALRMRGSGGFLRSTVRAAVGL